MLSPSHTPADTHALSHAWAIRLFVYPLADTHALSHAEAISLFTHPPAYTLPLAHTLAHLTNCMAIILIPCAIFHTTREYIFLLYNLTVDLLCQGAFDMKYAEKRMGKFKKFGAALVSAEVILFGGCYLYWHRINHSQGTPHQPYLIVQNNV